MPTVLREDGFIVRVYGPPREHPPPHVHVERGQEELVIIRLGTPDAPPAVWKAFNGFMAKPMISDKTILAQIPAARRRARASSPVAANVRYERTQRRLHVTLTNGATLLVPVELIASLRHASDSDLAAVRVGTAGVGLRWERLDEDLSIAGLARVALGTQVLMSASGSAGGASRSAAKVRAARINGLKGGRPRKTPRKSEA